MTHRNQLSRRTMLRGAGACLALPLLEAMLPRSVSAQPGSRQAGPKPRMVCCYVPNGVNDKQWMPKDTGRIGRCLPRWRCSRTTGRT